MKTTPNRAKAGTVNGTTAINVQGPDVEAFERDFCQRKPEGPWLVRSVNSFGQEEWFVRVEVSGMHPRRLGPLATKEEALKFYVHAIEKLVEELDCVLPENVLARNAFGVFVEDEIGSAYVLPTGGTHGRKT